MTVAELLASCPAQELTDWRAYEQIAGPLGAERADVRTGIIAATIANVNRGKRGRAFKPKDFIIEWDRPAARTPQAMRNMLLSLTRRFGGKVIDGDAG